MRNLDLVFFGGLTSFCLACMVSGLIPALYRRLSAGWIETIGEPIDPEMRELVQRERGRRLAWTMAGGLAGLLVGAFVRSSNFFDEYSPLGGIVFLAAFGTGLWGGQAARAFTIALRPDPGSVRAARATAPRLDDFVRVRAQIAMYIVVGAAFTLCVALAVAPIWEGASLGPSGSGTAWLGAAIIAVSFIGGQLMVRRLIQRPSPGASPQSVVWRHALRREMVADLYVAPYLAIMVSVWMVCSWGFDGPVFVRTWPLSLVLGLFYSASFMVPALIQYLNRAEPDPVMTA